MTYFLDFDRTLFDTDAFVAHLERHPVHAELLQSAPEESVSAELDRLVREEGLVFTSDDLKPFVYADVPEFLRMLGNEAIILTFGNPALQRMKISHALSGIPRLSVLYTDTVRKGVYLKERIAAYGAATVVDDRAVELEDLARECPGARLFEMRRDGGKGDGRWAVVHSLNELP